MAPLQDYITETEAAKICSVSVNTLNRFIETGYLQVEFDSDGLRLFAKDELKRVFGLNDSSLDSRIGAPREDLFSGNLAFKPNYDELDTVSSTAEEKDPSNEEEGKIEPSKPHLRVVESSGDSSEDEDSNSGRSPERHHVFAAPKNLSEKVEVKVEPAPNTDIHVPEQPRHDEQSKIYSQSYRPERAPAIEILEAETNKLKHVVTLLEKILELREGEIDTLKKQNIWLQQRIERMEERSNREQVLLLAESETVRRLVSQQKRSPIRAALEWLGLAEESNYKGTIDAEKGR